MSAQTQIQNLNQSITNLQTGIAKTKVDIQELVKKYRVMILNSKRDWLQTTQRYTIGVSCALSAIVVWFIANCWCFVNDIGKTNELAIVVPCFMITTLSFFLKYLIKDWREAKDELYLTYLKGE